MTLGEEGNEPKPPAEKLAAIDTFIEEMTEEYRQKKVNLGLLQPIKKYLLEAAMTECMLEGQIKELRSENHRLGREIDQMKVQVLAQTESGASEETQKQLRLEGQIEVLKGENSRLQLELENIKLDAIKLQFENEKLMEELAELKTDSENEEGTKAKLEAELRVIKEENAIIRSQKATSYAMAAALPAAPKQLTIIETKLAKAKEKQANVLFFKSTDKKPSKEVRDAITKTINPREDKVKIKAIRTTQSTVIVETATKEDAAKIAQKTSTLQNITCEETRKRRPMVIVYQVPNSISDEDFLDQLFEINLREVATKEEFNKEVSLKFKTGRKNARTSNNVLEVSPRLWCQLLKSERIYIDFESLRVKDFARISRCYTCHDLGHSTKQCKLQDAVCYKCGKPGHLQANCKEDPIGCIPCKYRKRTCNKAGGPDCPTHKQLLNKLLANTDYGQ